MTPRRYPLPLTTLGLTAGAAPAALGMGCTPAIVGDWDLKEVEIDGEDYSQLLDGYSGSYTYGDCEYTYSASLSFTLSVTQDKRDLEGEITNGYSNTYTDSCDPENNYTEVYSEDYELEVETIESGKWEIKSDDLDWTLECTIEGDELDCEGDSEGDDIKLVFERG